MKRFKPPTGKNRDAFGSFAEDRARLCSEAGITEGTYRRLLASGQLADFLASVRDTDPMGREIARIQAGEKQAIDALANVLRNASLEQLQDYYSFSESCVMSWTMSRPHGPQWSYRDLKPIGEAFEEAANRTGFWPRLR